MLYLVIAALPLHEVGGCNGRPAFETGLQSVAAARPCNVVDQLIRALRGGLRRKRLARSAGRSDPPITSSETRRGPGNLKLPARRGAQMVEAEA